MMLLGLITLECMTWTQGMTTLGPSVNNDKDEASWQRMIEMREKETERKGDLNFSQEMSEAVN